MSTNTITEMVTQVEDDIKDNIESENYFYLYRISYSWYAFIGFTLTMIIGTLTSWLFHKFYYSHQIQQNESEVDADLFITPLRRKLMKNNRKEENCRPLPMINGNCKVNNEHVDFHEIKTEDEEEILDPQPK